MGFKEHLIEVIKGQYILENGRLMYNVHINYEAYNFDSVVSGPRRSFIQHSTMSGPRRSFIHTPQCPALGEV